MTIELHSNLLNSMAGKLSSLLDKLTGQDTTLKDLQSACKTISSDEIDLSDVVTNIQNSSDSQSEQKKKLLKLKEKVENFIDKAEQVDTDVKDLINRRKDEFYKAHYNLKPYSEMGFWEKRWDNLKKVGQWCKEHWKLVVVILIVIVAVVCLFIPGVNAFVLGLLGPILGPILMSAFTGALWGVGIGGLMGGLSSMATGGSFLEGFENGAFTGAITGLITGGLGGVFEFLSSSCTVLQTLGVTASNFGKVLKIVSVISKVSGGISMGMFAFDALAVTAGAIWGNDNWFTAFNLNLHSSKLYNGFQIGIGITALLSGSMSKGMRKAACFVAGTMILTATGLVAIENIKAGDKVISTNEDTFETAEKLVLETYIRGTTELIHLTINGEKIITTFEHPFYVKEHGFVNAGELFIGDKLLDSNGNVLLVEDITLETATEPTTVYNFQVEDFHTYHVGKSGALVHNASMEYKIPSSGRKLEMNDVDIDENYEYTKKDRDLFSQERKTFESTSQDGVKAKFLKEEVASLGEDFLKSKGLSDADIARINDGRIPKDYNIHHKYPLDDGGTNSSDNLILIKQKGVSDHQNFTDYQNSITAGLKPGETKVIDWPVPTGKVY